MAYKHHVLSPQAGMCRRQITQKKNQKDDKKLQYLIAALRNHDD